MNCLLDLYMIKLNEKKNDRKIGYSTRSVTAFQKAMILDLTTQVYLKCQQLLITLGLGLKKIYVSPMYSSE